MATRSSGVLRAVATVLALVALATACSGQAPAGDPAPGGFDAVVDRRSWAPAPVERAGLRTVAEQDGERLLLHTEHGDVDFWAGINLGSTTPGHSPGELAVSRADYRRWFDLMRRAGVRVVRVYTIHPPQMYEELRRHNEEHPRSPLFLVQGVYLPDESYLESGDLFATQPTAEMTRELTDASAAVHGELTRSGLRGRANGTWTADVSAWTAGWLVGVEWDPLATAASDARNAAAPAHAGAFFASAPGATPTERWLAARMDELATAEAARGHCAPIAFVNWPTTDPLPQPSEPLPQEDLVAVDANAVAASPAWPAGTFASYHAYPYYPDFLRHETDYQSVEHAGSIDPYAGYLRALQRHHRGRPVMVTELGVPSSLGSAHLGTLGRDQGNHSEQQAMAVDAALLRLVKDLGLAGGLLFAWTDEWFKLTWNTLPRQAPVDSERRALWHDPLTNEQWFGLLAQDPVPAGRRVVAEARSGVREVGVDHDAAWVYLDLGLDAAPAEPLCVGFDLVPGGLGLPGTGGKGTSDYAVMVAADGRSATAWVRGDLDPVLLDGLDPDDVPAPGADGWALQRLTTNRALVVPTTGERMPAEFLEIGRLVVGQWEPTDPEADSRSTVRLDGSTLRLRLPWSMLGLADPSSHTAVVPVDGQPQGVPVDGIRLVVDVGEGPTAAGRITWEGWQRAEYRERVKAGAQDVVDALADTSGVPRSTPTG